MRHWLRAHRGFLLFLLCLGVFRTAVADWNPVPTGSMRPTIVEGDVVFVNRLAYDLKLPLSDVVLARLGEPRRGDIVTFRSPRDGTRLIKRLVALPGDVVAIDDGVLVVNGEPARYEGLHVVQEPARHGVPRAALRAEEAIDGRSHAVQFLEGWPGPRRFGPVVVPAGHYFMLGDNRHDSEDSRFIGPVARPLLIGRAERTLVSADILGHWWPRWERTGAPLR